MFVPSFEVMLSSPALAMIILSAVDATILSLLFPVSTFSILFKPSLEPFIPLEVLPTAKSIFICVVAAL